MVIANDFYADAAALCLLVLVWTLCVECRSVHELRRKIIDMNERWKIRDMKQ
jgi:hypothetical protein